MMKMYAVTRKDGGVTFTQVFDGFEIADEIQKWPDELKENVVSFREIDPADVPEDRTFRNAIKDDGLKIHHDLKQAKEIQKERWRQARLPLFREIDIEIRKNSKNSKKVDKLEAKAQALRDVTEYDLSGIKTVDELRDVWPEVLK